MEEGKGNMFQFGGSESEIEEKGSREREVNEGGEGESEKR